MSAKTKRGLGVGVSALIAGVACWSVVVACSSDETKDGFTADDASDVATPPPLDGTFPPGNDDAGGCQPKAPTTRVTPAPTKPFQPGSCTTAQVDGYLKECLQSDGSKCKAYKTASPTCAACIESSVGNASWGPIVFYENDRYYDYNYGGCIANVTGDVSSTGCGAAETRYLECRRAACAPCLPEGFGSFTPFYACQTAKATDALCATELSEVSTACAAYFAAKPVNACEAAGLPPADYLLQLMTGWCGGAAPDAGGDGGDGGDGG